MEYLDHFFERKCSKYEFFKKSLNWFKFESKNIFSNVNSKYVCLSCNIVAQIRNDMPIKFLINGKLEKPNISCTEYKIKKLLE